MTISKQFVNFNVLFGRQVMALDDYRPALFSYFVNVNVSFGRQGMALDDHHPAQPVCPSSQPNRERR